MVGWSIRTILPTHTEALGTIEFVKNAMQEQTKLLASQMQDSKTQTQAMAAQMDATANKVGTTPKANNNGGGSKSRAKGSTEIEADTGTTIIIVKADVLQEMDWVTMDATDVHIRGYSGILEPRLGKAIFDLKLGHRSHAEEIFLV